MLENVCFVFSFFASVGDYVSYPETHTVRHNEFCRPFVATVRDAGFEPAAILLDTNEPSRISILMSQKV